MPIVAISMIEGRTEEQKQALAAAVTTAVQASLNTPASAVRVLISEFPASHWFVAGEPLLPRR